MHKKLKAITPQRIKKVRASAKMTQTEMAEEMGVSTRFLRNLEIEARPIPRLVRYAIVGFVHLRDKKN